MEGLEQEIAKGLKDVFKGTPVDDRNAAFANLGSEPIIQKVVEPVVSTEPIVTSATTEVVKDEPVVSTEVIVSKSFEELFAEKTGGKFKTWEEVDALLNAPKEEYDDEIKHLAELKKSGVKFDDDFWEIRTKNYEGLDANKDAKKILLESMKWKPEFKGWSQEELEFELKTKYRQAEWSDDDEPTEVEKIMSKRMLRDAENEKKFLIEKKNSLLNVKKPDEAAIALQQEQVRQQQVNWEKQVEEISSKTSKLSVKLDDKESFDFELPESDKIKATQMMKEMGKDVSVFWSLFNNDKGEFDHNKVYELILREMNKDNIVKSAYQKAFSKGAEKEHKTIKNIDFSTSGAKTTPTGDWREKARQQVEANL